MKTIIVAIVIALSFPSHFGRALKTADKDDPCAETESNAGMRQCYTREQARVTWEADSAARKLGADFLKQAQDPRIGSVAAGELRKAASAVIAAQKMWKAYRNQHCLAVGYSWTTGSGAGTAQEACLFRLGQERLRELTTSFN